MGRLAPVEITVWVDSWQMQCCGDPFRRGARVSWTLLLEPDRDWLRDVLGQETADSVDAAEEHHGGVAEDANPIAGTVASIAAVHCRYAPRPGLGSGLYPVPGSGVLTELDAADGWTPERPDQRFVGYLVRITDVAADVTSMAR